MGQRRFRKRQHESARARPVVSRRGHGPRALRLARADRPALLGGTALASTLFLAAILGPAPALAVTETVDRENIVQNTDAVTNNSKLNTTLEAAVDNAFAADGLADFIGIFNAGNIGSSYDQTGNMYLTTELDNTASAVNSGEIDPPIGIQSTVNNSFDAFGNAAAVIIFNGANVAGTLTQQANQILSTGLLNTAYVNNSAQVTADDVGILGQVTNEYFAMGNANASVVVNAFDIIGTVSQTGNSDQVAAVINDVTIINAGGIDADYGIVGAILNHDFAMGNANATILAQGADLVGNLTQTATTTQTTAAVSGVTIENGGDITGDTQGILGVVVNYGINLTAMGNAAFTGVFSGADIFTDLSQSASNTQITALVNTIDIVNSGNVEADIAALEGIIINDSLDIGNAVAVDVEMEYSVGGDHSQTVTIVQSNAVANNVQIDNQGRADGGVVGIAAAIFNANLTIGNVASADLLATQTPGVGQTANISQANTILNEIEVVNSGEVTGDIGVIAEIDNYAIEFTNLVEMEGITPGAGSTQTVNVNQYTAIVNTITITNSGSIEGRDVGVVAEIVPPVYNSTNAVAAVLDTPANVTQDVVVENSIRIVNTGSITSLNRFAIETSGAATTITNQSGGVITGFVRLSEFDDVFDNLSGGTFEARRTSDFGAGFDEFNNLAGGTVHATGNTAFENLDRFTNQGVISTVNGRTTDVFEISNTVGQRDLTYVAERGSTLAVDAFLGGPGSTADNFIINGNVSGRTLLRVNNTNPGQGALNREGIPVVFVNGNVSRNAFFLDRPIDTGLFDYDLHFVPTDSGFFELRSHPGGGSHVLPRFSTAAQDIFFISTDTWFDRTADLRVLLNGGAPAGHSPNTQHVTPNGTQPVPGITPAVWVKGSGTWLEQDDKAQTRASGRTYRFDLNRDLDVAHFQTGIDFGAFDVLSPGDMVVYGVLGGAILGNLDYDQIARQFDISGGEVGAYVTYLKGGLFVDTLAKADFIEFDANSGLGFPGTFDSNAWGIRTDAGYRFGSFQRGFFFEPLATIAFNWVDVEDFTLGGNKVVLHDESVVRGRLGLRVGTSSEVWTGTLMEPFIIGSVWSNLGSDTNQATLTSRGTTFQFEDDLEDTWGVVSAGVNFFNVAASTSVFAKLDVTFGDETEGISGKGGMRVTW